MLLFFRAGEALLSISLGLLVLSAGLPVGDKSLNKGDMSPIPARPA
jgi:hypothetical protein